MQFPSDSTGSVPHAIWLLYLRFKKAYSSCIISPALDALFDGSCSDRVSSHCLVSCAPNNSTQTIPFLRNIHIHFELFFLVLLLWTIRLRHPE